MILSVNKTYPAVTTLLKNHAHNIINLMILHVPACKSLLKYVHCSTISVLHRPTDSSCSSKPSDNGIAIIITSMLLLTIISNYIQSNYIQLYQLRVQLYLLSSILSNHMSLHSFIQLF